MLDGGLTEGSVTLLAGHQGIGKTTLTLQALAGLGKRCLYATGEETQGYVAERAQRIGAMSDQIHALDTPHLEELLEQARSLHAQFIAVDTIQTLRCERVIGRPGSYSQIGVCTALLIDYARTTGSTLWLISHLTARGDISGPKAIMHDVDVVLELSEEGNDRERILSCSRKNRFGSEDAAERLRLTSKGFVEVEV